MKSLVALTALLPLALLFGFGTAVPSERVGETLIRKAISDSPDRHQYELVSFRQSCGFHCEQNGVPMYFMEYLAEIEFTSDCHFCARGDNCALRGYTQPSEGKRTVPVKKGHKGLTEGRIRFEKTTNGWSPCKKQD